MTAENSSLAISIRLSGSNHVSNACISSKTMTLTDLDSIGILNKRRSLNKRTAYTIIEILKMFDLAKKDTENSSKSVKFWDEVEKKNIIPDRTSQSLRTAWRKYSKYGEEQFIREALKDPKIRFSHQFETVPYLGSAKVNLPSVGSARAEPNEPADKSVDMTVLSQEASDEPDEAGDEPDEDLEFILAIDDLQSAFAFNATDCQSYSLKVQKRKTCSGHLHAMYDNRDDRIR